MVEEVTEQSYRFMHYIPGKLMHHYILVKEEG